MIIRWVMVVALLVLLVGCAQPPATEGIGDAALGERAQELLENQLADIERAVDENDIAAARSALDEFQSAFADIQAGVEAAAPEVSETISTTLTNLRTELNAETPDMDAVNEALGELRRALESLAARE
jgi:hypothetical protein